MLGTIDIGRALVEHAAIIGMGLFVIVLAAWMWWRSL